MATFSKELESQLAEKFSTLDFSSVTGEMSLPPTEENTTVDFAASEEDAQQQQQPQQPQSQQLQQSQTQIEKH